MAYNVKVRRYLDTTETVIYSSVVQGGNGEEVGERLRGQGYTERSIAESVRRSKAKVRDLVQANKWDLFVTLTLNGEKIDRYNYDVCSKKVRKWLNNLSNRVCPDLKYICVPELHEKGGYHFHGLFANCDGLKLYDSGKKTKSGLTVYNICVYKWGWSTATKIQDSKKAGSYIQKYLGKDLAVSTFNKQRYWRSRNCDLPVEETFLMQDKQIDLLRDTLGSVSEHTFYSVLWGEANLQTIDIYKQTE